MAKLFEEFEIALAELVRKVPEVERELRFGKTHSKPEEFTKQQLLAPFLKILGFDNEHLRPEVSIGKSGIGRLMWVDYVLRRTPEDRKGVALFEAKSLLEQDIWKKYQKQVRQYLHAYQLDLGIEDKDPVRWIVLTNFRELYILNIADYEPFFKLDYTQYNENAQLLFRLLHLNQLSNDQITSIYYEKRYVPLGKSFFNDLKLWRLLLANGLKKSQPDLTLEQIRELSQQILNRVIFIRVLETYGLERYYSLVRLYHDWENVTRNKDRFPFFDHRLMIKFEDIHLDYGTNLFSNRLVDRICEDLAERSGQRNIKLTIPNKYIRPLVDPDVYWPDRDQELRELVGDQTGQQRFALNTPYNYDFHTLTPDIMGQVYEQFLAQSLEMEGDRIFIRSDQTLRQKGGVYYTPVYVVRFLVEGTVGRLAKPIFAEAERCLQERRYQDAQNAIRRIQSIKVLDPACGSGSFLIAAYGLIVEMYKRWNHLLDTILERDFEYNIMEFMMKSGLQKIENPGDTVLCSNIFGIDRDAQAIEVEELNIARLLLQTQPDHYMRIGDDPPKNKLPDVSSNLIIADSLSASLNINALLGSDTQYRVILGNPPWGASISADTVDLDSFELARGQYDSYDLFIERVTQSLRPGDFFGYIVPDSVLQLPQHTRLRELILDNYEMDSLVKLGEGVFEEVFRGSVAFIYVRSDSVANNHKVRCGIVVKFERDKILKTARDNALQDLLDNGGISITQNRFLKNKEKVFDIFASDEDMKITQDIDQSAIDWDEVIFTSRGVELSKSGLVMACPHCGIWRPIPQKQKNGDFKNVKCANPVCGRVIRYKECTHAQIIMPRKTRVLNQPIIVGEGVNRYQIVEKRFIDTSKVRFFPRCPNPSQHNPKQTCNYCDFSAPEFVPGEVRICKQCGQKYAEADVKRWVELGIDYKSPQLYEGEKLLVRKTGRGIYATIDQTEAYTTQVVYIFKLRTDRAEHYQPLRLSYILGTLNSRMMLYRYYKALGDIEWKSFPYMTQKTIMSLPIRRINFNDVRQTYFHNQIADLVDQVISSGKPPTADIDAEIERLVRELYGVNTPASNAHIDSELERISQFGSLLGSSVENQETDETEEERNFSKM